MTLTATPATPQVEQPAIALSDAAQRRLDGIRPHIDGLTPAALTTLVEQAFRNFEGVSTSQLIQHLTTSPA